MAEEWVHSEGRGRQGGSLIPRLRSLEGQARPQSLRLLICHGGRGEGVLGEEVRLVNVQGSLRQRWLVFCPPLVCSCPLEVPFAPV